MSEDWPSFEAYTEIRRPEKPRVRMPSGELLKELESQAEYHLGRPDGDKFIAAFNLALIQAYQSDNEVHGLMEWYLDIRTDIALPSHAANLPLRAFQKQLLTLTPDYPKNFDSVESWLEAFAVILNDPSSAYEIHRDLANRLVQSNKSERYVSIKPLIRMFADRMSDEPRILDIGCSRNHGLKKIATNLAFDPVKSGLGEPGAHIAPYESSLLSVFDQMLQADVAIGPSTGSDVVPLQDNAEWAKACSFYPSELANAREDVVEYDVLDVMNVPEVEFIEANFIRRDIAHLPGYKASFDMVMLSTVMYQLGETERFDMLSNALWHVKPGGIVVVQDFAEIDPSNPRRLVYRDHWFDGNYPYRTFVLEVNGDGRLEFKEYFRWKTSRCRDVKIMPAACDKLAALL